MHIQPALKDILKYPQGYTRRVADTSELKVHGMTCAACVRRVERALNRVPGVEEAVVNYAVERATILAPNVDPQTLVQAVKDAGYSADLISELTQNEVADDEQDPKLLRDLIGAIALTIPIFLVSMFWHPRPYGVNVAIAVATTPVLFLFGLRFLRNAWNAAKHGEATMDTLIALGSLAAWGFSMYGLLRYAGHSDHHVSEHVYFETAAVTISLILLGRTLESRARKQMSSAIRGLAGLTPTTATLIGKDGVEVEIEAARIAVGDTIRVRLGSRIPADGETLESTAYVDESMITGEPAPVLKHAGSQVTGGTVVSSGLLTFRATRVGSSSTLAQIVRAVERAQGSKASIQRIADRVAGVFVPIVILIALSALVFWMIKGGNLDTALVNAVSILLVACPCALGLATPAAIMVGTGRAAELGILIRDGVVLERAGSIQSILTDKTGTLTEGKPRIVKADWERGVDGGSILMLGAALERLSNHPISQAIIAEIGNAPEFTVQEFQEIPGEGVVGLVQGKRLAIGNATLMKRLGVAATSDRHGVLFAVNGSFVGSALIADPIRPQAPEAVSQFQQMGIEVAMLTGDRREPAEAIAHAVGIRSVIADARPEDKLQAVESQKRNGKKVAMIGDGVNDAPALAASDLGIAMGSGTDIAMHTADMTLLRSDLNLAATAIQLARSTHSVVKWNLVWAFGYNILMIPLAFAGKLNPMLAAGAMAFSSLSVVLNSLRLRRFGR